MHQKIHFGDLPVRLELNQIQYEGPVFHRDAMELLFVLEDSLHITYDNHTACIEAGQCVVLDPGQIHQISGNEQVKSLSLYLDFTFYEQRYPWVRGLSFEIHDPPISEKTACLYRMIRNYLIRMAMAVNYQMPRAGEIMADIGEAILVLMCRYFVNMNHLTEPIFNFEELQIERIYSIAAYLCANYKRKNLSIADIAETQKVSPSRVAHFWKDFTSHSFQETLILYRIGEAARLLLENGDSISEISDQCGFSDEKYLYRNFKQYFGLTPSQFRAVHQKQRETADAILTVPVEEAYETVRSYGYRFYRPLEDLDFLRRLVDETETERNIFQVYEYVLLDHEFVPGLSQEQSAYLRMEPSLGLIRYQEHYEVNWEYIFTLVCWYEQLHVETCIMVNYGFLPEERWFSLLRELCESVVQAWRKKGQDPPRLRYVIVAESLKQYEKSRDFEERLAEAVTDCTVSSILIL